jgi:polar amino acid transport system substrate-binding protein
MGPAELLTIKKDRPDLNFTVVHPPPVTDQEVAEHPAWMSFRRKMTGFYIDPKQKDLEQAVSKEIDKLYQEGTFLKGVAKKYDMTADDLFCSEPYMSPQRIAVDRPEGWVAPTLEDCAAK